MGKIKKKEIGNGELRVAEDVDVVVEVDVGDAPCSRFQLQFSDSDCQAD